MRPPIEVRTFVERRLDDIKAVKWYGMWEDAHTYARLWRDCTGYRVNGDELLVELSGDRPLLITRGTLIEVEQSWGGEQWFAKRVLTGGDLKAYQLEPRGEV